MQHLWDHTGVEQDKVDARVYKSEVRSEVSTRWEELGASPCHCTVSACRCIRSSHLVAAVAGSIHTGLCGLRHGVRQRLTLPATQGMSKLPNAGKFVFPDQPYNFLRHQLPQLSEQGLQLINSMLTYDSDRRITARQALRHEFFRVRSRRRRLRRLRAIGYALLIRFAQELCLTYTSV